MALKPLDLQNIRRNWERSAATLPVRSPDRLGFVQPPLDVYLVGTQLLERLGLELQQSFPMQKGALAPFRARVERCLAQLRERAQAGDADAAELSSLREDLSASLRDLEDICEAFLRVPR